MICSALLCFARLGVISLCVAPADAGLATLPCSQQVLATLMHIEVAGAPVATTVAVISAHWTAASPRLSGSKREIAARSMRSTPRMAAVATRGSGDLLETARSCARRMRSASSATTDDGRIIASSWTGRKLAVSCESCPRVRLSSSCVTSRFARTSLRDAFTS